jgi:hypothetical protein
VTKVQPVERRCADLVKCSGKPAVRDGDVHERQYGAVFGRLSNHVCRNVPKYDRAMSAGVAETIDLTDPCERLRNSFYRVTFQTPA